MVWLLFGLCWGALAFNIAGVTEDQQMQAHTEHCAELGRVAQYRTEIGYVCCEEITIEGKTLHDNCTLSILDEDVDIKLIC